MKKIIKKCFAAILAATVSISTFTSCGSTKNSSTVTFWIKGTATQLEMYEALKNEFNKSYGTSHGIEVVTVQKPNGSYNNNVLITAGSSNGPDVFLVEDALIKSWVAGKYMKPITDEYNAITDINMGESTETSFKRLRYNEKNNSSTPNDPLYGVPVDIQPTALYYSKTKLEEAGIIVISVDESDMDAWNAGTLADKNGVRKTDIKKLDGITVPKKGFYRSESPYYYNGDRTKDWVKPTDSEVMVFNNRIAMNWDEVEDVAMLFSAAYNPKKGQASVSEYGTKYGYFTEWWFNYAWSVGGDCLNDLTGNGEFNFSLLDPNPNYLVVGDKFVGRTGKTYSKGEIVSFLDKMNIADNELLVPDEWGDYLKADGSGKAGLWSGITSETAKGSASTLAEIPSTKEAFLRYLKLGSSKTANIDGEKGLEISPNPSVVNARGLTSYFLSGELVFAANTSTYMVEWADRAAAYGMQWDLAPLVTYKRYTDPSDPQCDEVEALGKTSGHSNAMSLVVRNGSDKTDKAVAFLKWVAGLDGQRVRASEGFFPMQKSLLGDLKFQGGIAPNNVSVFSEALEYQTPGDWWYMKDSAWVERWCTDLNASLRNGNMTYDEWLNGTHKDSVAGGKVVVRTNEYLKNYNYSK